MCHVTDAAGNATEPAEPPEPEVEIDPGAQPVGFYYDYREVCQVPAEGETSKMKQEHYLLPIYRKKSKEFHTQVAQLFFVFLRANFMQFCISLKLCTQLGGSIPDLAKVGDLDEFSEDVFISSRIPRVLDFAVYGYADDGQEEIKLHKTPLNMVDTGVIQ